jgi:two-component system, sensor histidine kinase LadS
MIFLVYSPRGSISSHKLSEILSIRQSTCWLYSAKIKKAMKEKRKHGFLHTHEGWNAILLEESLENVED